MSKMYPYTPPPCSRCGVSHADVREFHVCPIDDDMLAALRRYAADNGRCWKSNLRADWSADRDLGEPLRRVRNILGPSGIERIPRATIAFVKGDVT